MYRLFMLYPILFTSGKVAIVTGGAAGIGLGIAQCLSHHGAHVVIADLNGDAAEKAAASLPTRSIGVKVDVTCEEAVNETVATAEKQFGQVDALVANAGHQYISPVDEFPYEQWKKMLAVHMDGTYVLTIMIALLCNCNSR
jgi:3-hydroxybutyrate dehydrogenase